MNSILFNIVMIIYYIAIYNGIPIQVVDKMRNIKVIVFMKRAPLNLKKT
jgi:hypothetical protein